MSLKYAILCFLLFLMVLFLAGGSYHALTRPLELVPDKGGSKREAKPGNPPTIEAPKGRTNSASYNTIAGKNIFHPERKDFTATGSGMSAKPVVRPQVILYGVTIAGDYRSASVVNPGRSLKKGEREQITVKLGERIGEYRLASVLSDRITMEAGEDTFEVLLYDPKTPKKRVDTRTEGKPAQPPPIPTDDARGRSGPSRDMGTPPSTPAIPKGALGETVGPPQQQPSAQTPPPVTPPGPKAPPPLSGAAAPQTPVPTMPDSIPFPQGWGDKPVPLPPGGPPPGGR